jgi:hypothetical protein
VILSEIQVKRISKTGKKALPVRPTKPKKAARKQDKEVPDVSVFRRICYSL